MKILDIKKRNWIVRIFTINYWRVTIEMENGHIKHFNCWADTNSPNIDSLLWHLNIKINGNKLENEFENNLKSLIGKSI